MSEFNKLYKRLMENMVSGPGGAFGDLGGEEHGGSVGNEDFYAPDDARVPSVIGQRKKKKGKKKLKLKKKSKDAPTLIRRTFPGGV